MSDYMPTTDEVRDGYYSPRESYEPDHNAEFDRWLAQHDAEITAKAGKRIIKLLENESRNCEKAGLWANGPELRGQLQELHLGLNAAIALIKGENKCQ